MSDFLISDAQGCADRLAGILARLMRIDAATISRWEGPWGSLAVPDNHYRGYRAYEDSQAIAVVVGGPLLRIRMDTDSAVPHGSRHTASVLRLVFENPRGDWHSDLLGPFCFLHIDKQSGAFTIVTDNMSFIPAYKACSEKRGTVVQRAFSTHPDAAALAVSHDAAPSFDPVSVCDFILHKRVTHPHTLYSNVKELAPATVHTFTVNAHRRTPYWRPQDVDRPFRDIAEAADAARHALANIVRRAAEEHGRLTFFLSAGEDSRTLVSMAPKDVDVHCITIAPRRNREARIARRVARALNVSWEFVQQPPARYLENLGRRAMFSGSNGLSIHAHMLGIVRDSTLADQPVVIGGFSANALLKGHFYRICNPMRGVSYQRFVTTRDNIDVARMLPLDDDVLAEVFARRRLHAERLSDFRTTMINEWMTCWPMSQDHEIVNLWSNRRLFASLEAFMCPGILDIAACLPAEWVLNRRLFQKTAAPYLQKTRWIPHSDGHYPAFPWYTNLVLQPMVRTGRRLVRTGRRERDAYAWPSAASCVASPRFQEMLCGEPSPTEHTDPILQSAIEVSCSRAADPMQRFAAAQVLACTRELECLAW